jgi:8-amino-7-oxononanoate synthase
MWDLSAALQQRREQNLFRQRRTLQPLAEGRCVFEGRTLINFSSNDYLGLTFHPAMIDTAKDVASSHGVGSGASHLVSGHSSWHHQLEVNAAKLLGRDRALLFSTGYMANLGVISALIGRSDVVIEDKLNHASLLDAAVLARAKLDRFVHNDIADLRRCLEKSTQAKQLVAVDGVFSMDGDIAPLKDMAALVNQYDAALMVDDAHGFGVLGNHGAGSLNEFGLDQQQVPILMSTLGKAIGSYGAIVSGSEALIESLIQFARPYIYTTALPPAVAAVSCTALEILSKEPERRQHLHSLIAHFKAGAQHRNIQLMASDTAIQPILVGDSGRCLKLSQRLLEAGFYVGAIRPPTVPVNTARLRVTLSAAHSIADVDSLLDRLAEVLND